MRPTIALAMIMKNEEENLPRLFKSIEGCFDEVHITDTGSTDRSVEVAKSLGAQVHTFEWCNDFSAARNASFAPVKTDFVMWLDLDDVLSDKEAFMLWRDTAMEFNDYWLSSYDYAHDVNGKCVCSFVRERVVRNKNVIWKYFVHEGILPDPTSKTNVVNTWKVIHKRSVEDAQKDKKRNLKLFEANKDKIDGRMSFYYGKEHFDVGLYEKGLDLLLEAITREDLAGHDRLLAIQYAAHAALLTSEMYNDTVQLGRDKKLNCLTTCIKLCHQGLILDPRRAELLVLIGDANVKLMRPFEALPYYNAAKVCRPAGMQNNSFSGLIFSSPDAYSVYPRNQMARLLANVGDFENALKEAQECQDLYKDKDSRAITEEILKIMTITKIDIATERRDEIVISTPPQGPYKWDEEIYKTKGMGGSETAAIETAKWLRKLTGKTVKIFNARDDMLVADSGVEYHPVSKLNEYFNKVEPKVHIAWRHNTKLTNAPTYLWGHDLVTMGAEKVNYKKMLCLTPFHKNYVMAMQGIPAENIELIRNGIVPERFQSKSPKNPNKIVFPSSPDRGLDRAIKVVEMARETYPDLELHVFYGFENLYKYGLADLARKLENMISTRPWVKYHGFTEQKAMTEHFKEAVVWLHPCDFVETSCITAIEMLCAGVYPVTRRLGGLRDTLALAEKALMATMLNHDCISVQEFEAYKNALLDALSTKAWERVYVDPDNYSWESATKDWLKVIPELTDSTHEVRTENVVHV